MLRILLAALLLLAPHIAHAQWHEASSAHFVVYSKGSPESVRKFAETLERFDQAMRVLRGWKNDPIPAATRVTIFVLESTDSIEDLHGGRNVAGFYSGRVSGSVAYVPRFASTDPRDLGAQAVLFHEYTHHAMLSTFANTALPKWLIEGWAEFHATAKIQRDGSVTFGSLPGYRVEALVSDSLPLDRILGGDLDQLTDRQTNALYGRGWLLTHFFTFEPARREQFFTYLAAINAGKPDEAVAAFGDLKLLDRDLDRYAKQHTLGTGTIAGNLINPGQIKVRPLTPGEAATMPVRIRSDRGVSAQTAPAVYEAAKKAAAPYPNDPAAQGVLAETAFDARDYAGAMAAAERALAADPRSMQALVYKARTQMALAEDRKDDSEAAWNEIRVTLATAAQADPDNPEVKYLYYRSFAQPGHKTTQPARAGLYRAFQLVPQDSSLRFSLAWMYLSDNKPRMARTHLAPLAYNPHNKRLAAQAGRIIARIDSGDTAGALNELNRPAESAPDE